QMLRQLHTVMIVPIALRSSVYTNPEDAQNGGQDESDRLNAYPVGGGLPAMNDDATFLTYRVDCIAGEPPPTKTCSFSRLRIV
ncbi:hypothetical protein, partial [Pseudomonas viridiflava]|uniref:hypothetical protein n=1 Tax=Pseudomonas viridiflava TaxID=33069 RepID=UPI00197F5341